jgi:ubiquinone/menaquinone biosynthesis C-methylase UbiE
MNAIGRESASGSASAYDVARLQQSYEHQYSHFREGDWAFHDTSDPVMRYLRDRRLRVAVDALIEAMGLQPEQWTALVVCGGVGGEGTYLANRGCRSVVVSDFSAHALGICERRDPRLRTRQLNAEALDVPDDSYDVVLVQDGLHELRRPVLGLTEMMRVARRAVAVIEPHRGIVSHLFGRVWERHEDHYPEAEAGEGAAADRVGENYVFRWNAQLFTDVARSYLMKEASDVKVIRFWNHHPIVGRVAGLAGGGRLGLLAARATYGLLDRTAWWIGNAMVGIVTKNATRRNG